MTERRVIVSQHALERARLRFHDPFLLACDVRADVQRAINEGREGLRPPAGINLGLNKRHRLHDQRFAWTPDLRRCYLVKRARSGKEHDLGKPILLVITAFTNGAKEEAA